MQTKLSTAPYKGVRDFYPDDFAVQKYIFDTMRRTAESFGYAEYSASILEPAELYRAKSGEEIVNEQMYVFRDRGEREVALRPEMTPTLARMVAGRARELSFPLRWYSIPNLFRYERPQRGRLREHWQLNVDLFGDGSVHADAEIITVASDMMKAFGLASDQFEIRVYDRKILASVLSEKFGLDTGKTARLQKLLDKRRKIERGEFENEGRDILGGERLALLNEWLSEPENVEKNLSDTATVQRVSAFRDALRESGVTNAVWDPSIVRGFDYYTGMVFEVFDKNPDNNRSLFGGGRYDNLLDIFGTEKISAVGFGMGDVTIRDTLETYGLIPDNLARSPARLFLAIIGSENAAPANALARMLRTKGVAVAADYTDKKVGDRIKKAEKDGIPFFLLFGDEETKTGKYRVKKLATGEEKEMGKNDIADWVKGT